MSSDMTSIDDEPLELSEPLDLTDEAPRDTPTGNPARQAEKSKPLPDVLELTPRIAVIGVGGAGGNAVNNMIAAGLEGVTFIVANTDAQALAASEATYRIQLGMNLTEGLGAGSKPEIGEAAAEEAIELIRDQIAGCHMVFVAAGMGGGTGTGAAAVVARVAHEMNILTVGVVTKPFHFEGNRRMRAAEIGIGELEKHVDTLIAIPNQNLFRVANEKTTFAKAFEMADEVLHAGISCVTDLIVREGLINLDFADVRAIMLDMGAAMMGTGEASGENRAVEAAEIAIANPLLDDVTLKGARGLLVSISGGEDLTLYEVDAAANRIREEVDPEANIIVGANFDTNLDNAIRVSIVASGLRPVSAASQPVEAGQQNLSAVPAGKSNERPATPPPARIQAPAHAATPAGQQRQQPPGHGNQRPAQRQPAAQRPSLFARAPQPQPQAPQRPSPSPGAQDAGTPGNVKIEVGPPRMLTAGTLARPVPQVSEPPKAASTNAAQAHAAFVPAAPETVRRTPPRMPEINDFPPIAQRALRQDSEPETTTALPRKRTRLFDRLKGRSAAVARDEHASSEENTVDFEQPAATRLESEQEAEIPGFFKRQVRG